MLAGAGSRHEGPINVVGPGAVRATQAVRMGRRLPIPVIGIGWRAAALAAEMQGAPLPQHAEELIRRGGTADGTLARSVLGIEPRPTHDVVTQLYRWHTVAHVEPAGQGANR
jgi:hypothetical protein